MSAREQVWRLTWFGRIVAAGFASMFAALAIAWLVAPAPVWLHLLAVLPAAATIIPVRIARSKIVLTADSVLIRNPFDSHQVPLSQITSVTNLPQGTVHVTTAGGARIEVFAVHTALPAWLLGRRSRVNELLEMIEDAALARGALIPPQRLRLARGASAVGSSQASPLPPAPPQRRSSES